MANIDGNYDNAEKVDEWIEDKSKFFNEDIKDWEPDIELKDYI